MSWNRIRLGDIAIFRNGINFGKESYGKGVSLIGVSDFKNRFYPDYETLAEVKESVVGVNDYLDYGDIVFVRSNGNKELVGRCMVIKPTKFKITYSGFCIRTRIKNKTEHDPIFWTYHFKNISFRKSMSGNAIGTNIQNLSQGMLSNYETEVPDYNTQRRIASILSTYDDFIENNQKQIKLLEESAQRLYKEWFVDLRFPGYENVEIVDGVPEGWYINRADHYFKITIGKTPSRAEKQWFTNSGEGTPWTSISDMGESGAFAFYSKEDLTADAIIRHNMKVVPKGTILVSFKLTVGRVAITSSDMCTNEAIAHFHIDNDLDRPYTYCYLKNFEYDSLGNTSSISKAINSKIIKSMPFIMPSEDILGQFAMIVQPILDQIELKQKIIFRLTEARDRLLPKLMSGEIEV